MSDQLRCRRPISFLGWATAAAGLLGLLAAACGGTSLRHTVTTKSLAEASREGRLWIYDAENEIVVALDRLDEALGELRTVRQQMSRAERAIERLEKRGSRGAVQLAEAWLVYLEAMEEWAEANVALCRKGLIVARAAVELARAEVIQREDLVAGKDFSVQLFQDQYKELNDEFGHRRKSVAGLRQQARTKETQWWSLRRRVVAQTGDHNSGLWIE